MFRTSSASDSSSLDGLCPGPSAPTIRIAWRTASFASSIGRVTGLLGGTLTEVVDPDGAEVSVVDEGAASASILAAAGAPNRALKNERRCSLLSIALFSSQTPGRIGRSALPPACDILRTTRPGPLPTCAMRGRGRRGTLFGRLEVHQLGSTRRRLSLGRCVVRAIAV